MLWLSYYRARLVPRHAGWFPRLSQGAQPRSRKVTTTLWVLPVCAPCAACGCACVRRQSVVRHLPGLIAMPCQVGGRGAAP